MVHIIFESQHELAEHTWRLQEIDPEMPSDWSAYNYLVFELKASSSQRFELVLYTTEGRLTKRIHPFPGAWIRLAVPLAFYRAQPSKGFDMASTWNQPRGTGWINVEHGGHGPLHTVESLGVCMWTPIKNPSLDIRSLRLTTTDPGDAVLEPKALVDEFGQWRLADWPGKVNTLDELQAVWKQEDATLQPGDFHYGRYGGYLHTQVEATGFFRVEQIQDRWWFIDPDGHLFFSSGVNVIRAGGNTLTEGRVEVFAMLPPDEFRGPARGNGLLSGASFSAWNLQRRYGSEWKQQWAEMTIRRMDAWGLTTVASWSDPLLWDSGKKAYVVFLHGWGIEDGIMGLPDVYSQEFVQRANRVAAEQCAPRKDDPWLLGYFIGNEQPWPGRELLAVEKILQGPETAMQQALYVFLAEGDSPERRKSFIQRTFEKFLDIVNGAIKAHDPNHLNLGIRFGGTPPDEVIRMAQVFDVYSFNIYMYAVSPEYLDNLYRLTGRPVLIGEFHFGTPGRGLAPGLAQVKNQHERGVAYRYFVEQAAAHPAVIGTYWFQWQDQPNTGRDDGENYNIGIVDVTDQPYPELVAAMQATHARLFDVHSGNVLPIAQPPEGQIPIDYPLALFSIILRPQ